MSTGDESPYTFEFLVEAVYEEDVEDIINSMRGLSYIAQKLGWERTRGELIPFLDRAILDDDDVEIRLTMAEQLGRFIPYIGGIDYASVLLPPLENLCSSEEKCVRDKMVEALSNLGSQMNEQDLIQSFVPLLKRLSVSTSTAQATSCGLFHIAYPNSTEPLKNDLRTLYGQLCRNATGMVRKEAARYIGKFAKTIEPLYWKTEILSTFKNLTSDDPGVIVPLTGNDLEPQEWVTRDVQDTCRRGCRLIPVQLNELREAVGQDATRADLITAYVWLVGDDDNEIHSAAVDHLMVFCDRLTPLFLLMYILNSVEVLLSQDPSQYYLFAESLAHLVFCFGWVYMIMPSCCCPDEQQGTLDFILDGYMYCWRRRLQIAERSEQCHSMTEDFTWHMASMLLITSEYNVSFLSLISSKFVSLGGLLEILVRAESFIISDVVVDDLHKFLWKLLDGGEPQFKIEFGNIFLAYYTKVMKEAVKVNRESRLRKYKLVSRFGVKVFELPSLNTCLLLTMLLQCLGDVIQSYESEDSLEVIPVTYRVMCDILNVNYIRGGVHRGRVVLGQWVRNLKSIRQLNPKTPNVKFYIWWCIMTGWMTIEIRKFFPIR